MVSEKMKKQRCKHHYYVELVDTLRMKSGYDEELTTSAENTFHTGIALYLYIKRVFVSVNLRGWESDLKVVTGPCKAIRRHGDEVIGKEDDEDE